MRVFSSWADVAIWIRANENNLLGEFSLLMRHSSIVYSIHIYYNRKSPLGRWIIKGTRKPELI